MNERNKLAEYYDAELANVTGQLFDALNEIKRLKAERLKLDRRIHNQRQQLRETWEIVEKRRKWLGSQTARQAYIWLLKRYKALQADRAAP